MTRKRHAPHARRARRGLASLLAMLFLVLFATLAVGFAAATAMNGQIARNERSLQMAEAAADGGMQFMRYQLGAMTIPPGPQQADDALLAQVATALGTQMNATSNMNGDVIAVVNRTIFVPSVTDWITLDKNVGTRFRAMIYATGQKLVVTVEGAGPVSTGVLKAIQMQFQQAPKAGAILDYGVATQGTLATAGSTVIQGLTDPTKGSVLSADMSASTPVVIDGKVVSGDVSIVNPNGNISVAGASVGQTSNPTQMQAHLHVGVPAPAFPYVDTSIFTQYALTPYDGSGTCNNCYIPAGSPPVSFAGGATINGVLYVQAPNNVTFTGNTTINGVIVSDTGSNAKPFNASQNTISFQGTVTATPINQLPTSSKAYNSKLVNLTGSFLLAPNFAVSMTGDFGTIGGSMVVGQLNMSGNASGTVQGSVIGMQDISGSGSASSVYLNGHSSITISSTGTTNYPSGLSFGSDYTPLSDTYSEVVPW